MRKYYRSLALGLLLTTMLTACSTTDTQYYWGNYEHLIYQMYTEPGAATPEVQIEKLSVDIQKAESLGKKVPPGLYAHLGFMYSLAGNTLMASNAFKEEVILFPDSKILIDNITKHVDEIKVSP